MPNHAPIHAAASAARVAGLIPAISYCRVSGIEQVKGMSLASQEQTNQRTAEQLGARIIHTIQEQHSGAMYSSREGIQEALELIESGVCSMLCVAFVDRSGRDVDVIRDIHRRVCQAGAQFATPRGVVGIEADAVAMLTMEALFAEWERGKIKQRTDMGKRKKAEAGICPTRLWAPLGFTIVRKSDVALGLYPESFEGRYVASDAAGMEVVREVYERTLAGDSLRSILRFLESSGAKTARGGQWHQSALSTLLKNPIYCGRPVWGSAKHSKDERRITRGLSLRLKVSVPPESRVPLLPPLNADGSLWEPIVTQEQWDAVQAQLAHNKIHTAGNPDKVRLLSGLLRCPRCGGKMRGKNAREGSPNYACSEKGCYFYLSAKVAHELVLTGIRWLYTTEGAWEAAQRRHAELSARPKPNTSESEKRRLVKALAELESQEAAVSQALIMAIKAGGKAEVLAAELGSIESKRAGLMSALRAVEGSKGKNESQALSNASQLMPVLQKMTEIFEEGALPVPQQRAILSRFVRSITPRREGKNGPVMLEMVLGVGAPTIKKRGADQPFEQRNSFLCSIWPGGKCSLTLVE